MSDLACYLLKQTKSLKSLKKEYKNIDASNLNKFKIDKYGSKIHFYIKNNKKVIHHDTLPAIISAKGNEYYYKHGICVRADGPAIASYDEQIIKNDFYYIHAKNPDEKISGETRLYYWYNHESLEHIICQSEFDQYKKLLSFK